MAKNNALVYVGMGAIAWYVLRKYRLYQGIQFSVAGASVRLDPFELNIRMNVNNPTPVTARLSGITGSIYQNNAFVAQVNSDQVQVIAPYNRSMISLTIKPDILGVLQAVANYRIPFQFVGSAVVDGIPIPLNLTYQL